MGPGMGGGGDVTVSSPGRPDERFASWFPAASTNTGCKCPPAVRKVNRLRCTLLSVGRALGKSKGSDDVIADSTCSGRYSEMGVCVVSRKQHSIGAKRQITLYGRCYTEVWGTSLVQ